MNTKEEDRKKQSQELALWPHNLLGSKRKAINIYFAFYTIGPLGW